MTKDTTVEDKMTKDQRLAWNKLHNTRRVFLTGDAGTGKSFIINQYIEEQKKLGKKVLKCASTGIAALNIDGVTLHRALDIPVKVLAPDDGKNVDPSIALKAAEILVVDEISMLRFDTFQYAMNQVLLVERIKRRTIQVILVGDFFQLPPVITNEDNQKLKENWEGFDFGSGFAFCAPNWKLMKFEMVELREIVRQSELETQKSLNQIKYGNKAGIAYINKCISKKEFDNYIFLCSTIKQMNAVNEKWMKSFSDLHLYEAEIKGECSEDDYKTDPNLYLAVNMRVMCVVNDKDGRYQNGSIGTIVQLNEDSVVVLFDKGDILVKFSKYQWDIKGYEDSEEKVVANFSQIPLKHAYAITIHKSQGLTLDGANLYLKRSTKYPQVPAITYVAISRVKDLSQLFVKGGLKEQDVVASEEVLKFYEEARNKVDDE